MRHKLQIRDGGRRRAGLAWGQEGRGDVGRGDSLKGPFVGGSRGDGGRGWGAQQTAKPISSSARWRLGGDAGWSSNRSHKTIKWLRLEGVRRGRGRGDRGTLKTGPV